MDYLQPKFYRFSGDSLWLAEIASGSLGKNPLSLLDIGSGCGVVGIEAANRTSSIQALTLLEPQQEFFKCLDSNIRLLKENCSVELVHSAVENYKTSKKFNLVLSNPPYFKSEAARISPNAKKAMCRSFLDIDLVKFLSNVERLISSDGEGFVLAHESNQDVTQALKLWDGKLKIAAKKGPVLVLNFFA